MNDQELGKYVMNKGKEKTGETERETTVDPLSTDERAQCETEFEGQKAQASEQEDADGGEVQTEATPEQSTEETLRAELSELNERFLRVSADYQNFVRRAQQNVSDARTQQLTEMARALLVVLDHFDRALEIDPESTGAKVVLEGMQIVRDELLKVLERFGIQRVEVSAGDEFDPNRHEALMRQAGEGIEPNHVVAQLQAGYVLGDKVIRPAQVSVGE